MNRAHGMFGWKPLLAAVLLVSAIAGCGESTEDADATDGDATAQGLQTVTIHIPEMVDRLELL